MYEFLYNGQIIALQAAYKNAIPPEDVAQVILNAVKSDNPDFRNIVGDDAKSILEVRSNNTDKEFEVFMKKQFGI
jgi:hypothetical protein